MASNDEAEVSLLFEDAKAKLEKIDVQAEKEKKQIIIQLAKDLEEKIPTDTISIEIVNQLHDRVSERFIHNCLEEKYKQKYRVENARKQKKKDTVHIENLAVVAPLNQEAKTKEVILEVDGREETILPPSSKESIIYGTGNTGNGHVPLNLNKDSTTSKQSHCIHNPISSSNEIVDCECCISWPEMQRYVQYLYRSGRPLQAWLNFRFNKQTGAVIAVYLGRITERNKIGQETSQ